MRIRNCGAFLLAAAIGMAGSAKADIIYVADAAGNVGAWNTVSSSGVALGNLSSASISQVLGIGFDATTNAVIIADRNSDRVFTMDATTGASSLLFNSTGTFQGVAVSGGNVWGTTESSQQTDSYSLGGVHQGPFASVPSHTHAVGVDGTGQVYILGADNTVRKVNGDGSIGAAVVTASPLEFVDDVDAYLGDFLVAQFSNQQIGLIDGTTGAYSTFLSTAQLQSMGVLSGITGVAVRQGGTPNPPGVPEPGTVALLVGFGVAGTALVRRRK